MRVLYLTYDGLADPLGQSQILPYIFGLAEVGHKFVVVSFEKKENEFSKSHLSQELRERGIEWHPLSYTKQPPVLSTIYDLVRLRWAALKLHRAANFDLVHCRSYLTSIVGLYLKRTKGVKFIFDMRGFWADERVDGRVWNLHNPLYKLIYKYFKKKERSFLEGADHIITLTFKAQDIMESWKIKDGALPISVIPTCVDRNFFSPGNVTSEEVKAIRGSLSINESDFILTYLGSLGTWYLVKEMIAFFSILKARSSSAKFLIITKDDPSLASRYLAEYGLERSDLIYRAATRREVPIYISLSNWTIFFIQPLFSKAASAPTKMAEILSMNKPILFNLGVGDLDHFDQKYELGIGLKSLDQESFEKAAKNMLDTPKRTVSDNLVSKYFDLGKAVKTIDDIYTTL